MGLRELRHLTTTTATKMTDKKLRIVWSTHNNFPGPSPFSARRLAILDSSFNPPHASHHALLSLSATSCNSQLLLIGTSNADKSPSVTGDGNASTEQRTEMMCVLARSFGEAVRKGRGDVGVAVVEDEKFFWKKAGLVRDTLGLDKEEDGQASAKWELVWLMGWDTLIRFFSPKYYAPPSPPISDCLSAFFLTSSSSIICARRPSPTTSEKEEEEFLSQPLVKEYIELGKIKLVDLEPEELRGVSSSGVRKGVKEGGEEWEKWVERGVAERMKKWGLYKA